MYILPYFKHFKIVSMMYMGKVHWVGEYVVIDKDKDEG